MKAEINFPDNGKNVGATTDSNSVYHFWGFLSCLLLFKFASISITLFLLQSYNNFYFVLLGELLKGIIQCFLNSLYSAQLLTTAVYTVPLILYIYYHSSFYHFNCKHYYENQLSLSFPQTKNIEHN